MVACTEISRFQLENCPAGEINVNIKTSETSTFIFGIVSEIIDADLLSIKLRSTKGADLFDVILISVVV